MGWLLADQGNILLQGLALVGAALAVLLGSFARTQAMVALNEAAAVLWRDLGSAAWAWAAATGTTLAGSLARVEGMQMPVWLLVELLVGAGLLAVVRYRWSRQRLTAARTKPVGTFGPAGGRVKATTWQFGLLGAVGGGSFAYLVTLDHAFGEPTHWVLAGVGLALGYGLAVAMTTPRYSLRGSYSRSMQG
jgi:hypothetical protein